jgi:hypothetical protein
MTYLARNTVKKDTENAMNNSTDYTARVNRVALV